MPQPAAVIFDIGNVLIEWQPERFYDRVIGPALRTRLFAEVDLHGMNAKIDQGEPFRQTIDDCAGKFPQWADMIRLWHDGWAEIAAPAIPRSVRLLRALKARGVPVFVLSNIGAETYAIAQGQYDFLTMFDRNYISGKLRMSKPQVQIFQTVEVDCGLPPERLLFVDDREENIAAAANRGWQVHHFEGVEGWAARLVAEALLTQKEAQ